MRLWLLVLGIVACDPLGGVKAPVSSDTAAAANGGGCYPTGVKSADYDMVVLTNPEWVPLLAPKSIDSGPMMLHGIAHNPHGDTGGDNPITHASSDMTAEIAVDPEDQLLVATGNLEGESGMMEIEWESGFLPDWAWPGEGQRIAALGRAIFDCGHPGATPGHCSATESDPCIIDSDCRTGETCESEHFAYQSEIHPPKALAVIRDGRGAVLAPGAPPVPAARVDIFVSANGGGAGDRCILTHQPRPFDVIFSTDCFPLGEPLARINDDDFVFDVPLPPRPPGAHAVWQVMDRPADGGIPGRLEVTANENAPAPYLSVRVVMTEPSGGQLPTGYAATMFAGWDQPTVPLTHVRVTVDAVVVSNAEKEMIVRDAPGWRMQASVNGEWQRLSGLDSLLQPATVPEQVVFDLYLPPDGSLHFLANGVSSACIDTLFGQPVHKILDDIGLANFGMCLQSTNHAIGSVEADYPGPDFGAGAHETASTGADDPSGSAYKLQYHIERL